LTITALCVVGALMRGAAVSAEPLNGVYFVALMACGIWWTAMQFPPRH
jgi:hypothetical protein